MALGLSAALFSAAMVLAAIGAGERGTIAALRLTGRLAFLFFWRAYAGSALTALFGPAFKTLRQYGRELGLAFAGAILVHLGLVTWLCRMGHAPSPSVFAIFGTAAFLTILFTILSIGGLQRALGAWGCRLVRVVGLNYIAYAFAIDFTRGPFGCGVKRLIEYLPFAILAVAGPTLWLAGEASRLTARRPH